MPCIAVRSSGSLSVVTFLQGEGIESWKRKEKELVTYFNDYTGVMMLKGYIDKDKKKHKSDMKNNTLMRRKECWQLIINNQRELIDN